MLNRRKSVSVKEICVFSMLGALMFCSKILMEFLPNVHFLAVLIVSYTIVYRKRALIPIYIFVLLVALYNGFASWCIPYFYIWTVLWLAVMLLPKNIKNQKIRFIVYSVVCSLHGFTFGLMYAPAQALLYGMSFQATIAWIISGFPWDCVQGIGNLCLSILIIPISELLKKLENSIIVI